MPLKQLGSGLLALLRGNGHCCPVERIVSTSVLVVDTQAAANHERAASRYGQVALIKEPMEVRPQQESVLDIV